MAVFQNDPFPGTDYSQYLNWKKVTTPDGQSYYVVPGNSGYVYDPVLSNARGRKVFRANPQGQIDASNQQDQQQQDLIKQQKFNQSPAGQLLPIAGSVGGLVVANELLKPGETATDLLIRQQLAAKGAQQAGVQISNGAAAAQGAGSVPLGQTVLSETPVVPPSPYIGISPTTGGSSLPVPQLVNQSTDTPGILGGAEAASAAETPWYSATSTASDIGSSIAAAKGAYDTFNGFQHGGEGLRSGTTELGAGVGGFFGGPLGAGAGAIVGNTIGYGLQGNGWKNNLALAPLTGGVSLIPGVGNAIRGLIHKTTRQVAQEHNQDLAKQAPDDPTYQNYLGSVRSQYNSAPQTPDKPFAGGKYSTFQEYKQAGLDANDLTGVYGNIKTFGPEWAHLTFDQQKTVTQKLIDNNLYDSKKGEVEITDPEKAKQIYDSVKAGFNTGVSAASNGQAAAQGALKTPVVINGPKVNTNGLIVK